MNEKNEKIRKKNQQENSNSVSQPNKKLKIDKLSTNIKYSIYKTEDNDILIYDCKDDNEAEKLQTEFNKYLSEAKIKHEITEHYLIMYCGNIEKLDSSLLTLLSSGADLISNIYNLNHDVLERLFDVINKLQEHKESEEKIPLTSLETDSNAEISSITRTTVSNDKITNCPPIVFPALQNYGVHKNSGPLLSIGSYLDDYFPKTVKRINDEDPLEVTLAIKKINEIINTYAELFKKICSFILFGTSAQDMTKKKSLLNFAVNYTEILKKDFAKDTTTLSSKTDEIVDNAENFLISNVTPEGIKLYCQKLFTQIKEIISIVHTQTSNAEIGKLISKTQQDIQMLINSAKHIAVSEMPSKTNTLTYDKTTITKASFFNNSQNQTKENNEDFQYTHEVIERLLLLIKKPNLKVTLVQHPYIDANSIAKFQQILAQSIYQAVKQNEIIVIPIQEFYEVNQTLSKQMIFLGSGVLIKAENNNVLIKYIDPYGSCYELVSNTRLKESVNAQYRHIEKEFRVNDVLTNTNPYLTNPGICLSPCANKFMQLLNTKIVEQLNSLQFILNNLEIDLSISGFVTCTEEKKYVGGYLISCMLNEIYNKPFRKWPVNELVNAHKQYLNKYKKYQDSHKSSTNMNIK